MLLVFTMQVVAEASQHMSSARHSMPSRHSVTPFQTSQQLSLSPLNQLLLPEQLQNLQVHPHQLKPEVLVRRALPVESNKQAGL